MEPVSSTWKSQVEMCNQLKNIAPETRPMQIVPVPFWAEVMAAGTTASVWYGEEKDPKNYLRNGFQGRKKRKLFL